jgi:hypothetical protein
MISEATENASEVVARSEGDAAPDATGEGGGPNVVRLRKKPGH